MEGSNKSCCLGKILKLIEKLQRASDYCEEIDNSCLRPYLGAPISVECYNTRPITFYRCDNTLLTVDYTTTINGTVVSGTSNIFRIERVENCCAVCSILIPNPDTTAVNRPYITTNNTTTINLNCVCAIKCLGDTTVDL